MYGDQAATLFLDSLGSPGQVLDIGAGRVQEMRPHCEKRGHTYTALDWRNGQNWETCGLVDLAGKFDGVWMSHVLEHLLDTHTALRRLHAVTKPDAVIAITVPPLKHEIVGGHVSLWNAGLLLYRLVLAGFDCSKAAVKTYGYNISVVVRRNEIRLPQLKHDNGDLQTLRQYFPVEFGGEFDGQIRERNWRPV